MTLICVSKLDQGVEIPVTAAHGSISHGLSSEKAVAMEMPEGAAAWRGSLRLVLQRLSSSADRPARRKKLRLRRSKVGTETLTVKPLFLLQEPTGSPLSHAGVQLISGNHVMPLVNALQPNSSDIFLQRGGESPSRFMKIKSLWPFPVIAYRQGDGVDSDQPPLVCADEGTPSSFVT